MERCTYSANEAAKVLGVSLPTIYRLCKREDFPSFCVGRKIVIPKDELHMWLHENAMGRR